MVRIINQNISSGFSSCTTITTVDHKLPFYYESQTCCLFPVNSNPKQVTFLCNQKHKGKNGKNDAEEHFILNTGGYGFCCGGLFCLGFVCCCCLLGFY